MADSITVNGVVFHSEGECFGMCPYVNGETQFILDCEDGDWSVTIKGCDLETWHRTPGDALFSFAHGTQHGRREAFHAELARLGIVGGK